MAAIRATFPAAVLLGVAWAVPAHADHAEPSFLVTIRATYDPLGDFEPKVGETDLALVTFANADIVHHDLYWTTEFEEVGPDGVYFKPIGFVAIGEHVSAPVGPGTHPYVCLEHPWMHGVLRVERA